MVHLLKNGTFKEQKRQTDLDILESEDVMAMIVIGKRGPRENILPNFKEQEFPNDRNPLTEIMMKGYFRETN